MGHSILLHKPTVLLMVEIMMDYFRMLHKPITLSPLLLVENENIPISVECLLHKPIALH